MLSAAGVRPQFMEVRDFSGGMTDNFIGGPTSRFELADNFVIRDDGKLLTRPALSLVDTAHPRVTNEEKINSLWEAQGQLFQIANKRIYYNSSGFTHVAGPTSNDAFPLAGANSYYSWTRWNNHILATSGGYDHPVKLFKDGSTWKVQEIGLPALASTPTITGTGSGHNYLYAFHHQYTYTAAGITYEEVGPVTFSANIQNSAAPDSVNIAVSAIPVLANSTTRNWLTASIKVKIYRTDNNGDVYYYIGEVTNGTTTFNDNVSNATAQGNPELYTEGGTLEHEPPPQCRFLHQINNVVIYAGLKEGGVEYPTKFRISNVNQPWSVPAEFEKETDEEIKGVSSINGYAILFCENKIYRGEGFFLPDGSGDIFMKVISETAGCLSERSIVQTEFGLFWAGNDGYYFTDGSRVQRISEEINVTYKANSMAVDQKSRVYGTYYPKRQWIVWTAQEDEDATEADSIYVCHLRNGPNPAMAFTTWSGGTLYASNFRPTAVFAYDGTLYHADPNGYLLKYDDSELADVKINADAAVSEWTRATIFYEYRSCAYDFGSTSVRKWVPHISVIADNASSVSLLIASNNDNGGSFRNLAVVQYRGTIAWGDDDIPWGDPEIRWDFAPIITARRKFPKPGLRCMYKQVRFTNAYVEIETSTDLGENATFDNAANTAVLATKVWPEEVADYDIYTAEDGYVRGFPIVSRTDTTLTLTDEASAVPTGTAAWKIYGYRKDEVLKLISYTLEYADTSATQDPPGVSQ